jgi:hypothetical protein
MIAIDPGFGALKFFADNGRSGEIVAHVVPAAQSVGGRQQSRSKYGAKKPKAGAAAPAGKGAPAAKGAKK